MHFQKVRIFVNAFSVFNFFLVQVSFRILFQKISQIGNFIFGIKMNVNYQLLLFCFVLRYAKWPERKV